jgi:predicted ATPase/DNA-binding SARP family transcriptional activator
MGPPRLALTLLGGFQARLDPGPALAVPSRKGQALLAYLALSPGRVHSRDTLAALLWAESPAERARASLRHVLAVTRRALGPASRRCLTTDAETVALDPQWVDVDVTTFERLATGDLAQLESAVRLYGGDLLEGLRISEAPFEEWLLSERERLRERAVDALARMLATHRRASNTEAAIQAALRLLALDPIQEPVHRVLIELYAQVGRRGAALRQYQMCVDVLERELGVGPEAATRKLHRELLAVAEATGRELEAPATHAAEQTSPPRSRARCGLPAPAVPIIGRSSELDTLRAMLLDPGVRLLTLIGAPGVGKTRLALELAWEACTAFADGAHFVELAAIRDPELVPSVIRQALDVPRIVGPAAERAALYDHLRDRSILLVLDNFEQVIAAAPLVADLLAAGPGVKILVTSRASLHVYGEHQFTVPSLTLPDLTNLPTLEKLSRVSALALFVARAKAVQPEFALTAANASEIAAICVGADGLPLAIELAAAQIKDLSPAELLRSLGQPLALLKADDPTRSPRQNTLHAAIAWSYSLLDPTEQRSFARLGVFAGGFDVHAARAVGAEDVGDGRRIRALVDKSLVQRATERPEGARFRLLETLRTYALDRLIASGEELALRRTHAAYFVALSDELAQRLMTSQYEVVEHLQREHDNFRTALAWLLAPVPPTEPSTEAAWRAEAALRVCANLWRFWWYRCHLSEGQRWTTTALQLNQHVETPSVLHLRGQALWGVAHFSTSLGQEALAQAQLAESLELCERAGWTSGVGSALTALGWLAGNRGETDRAIELQQRAIELFQEAGDDFRLAYGLNRLCKTLRGGNRHDAAKPYVERSLEICRRISHDRGRAVALANHGAIALIAKDVAGAAAAFRSALVEFVRINDGINIATCLIGVAGTRAEANVAVPLLGFARRLLTTTAGQLEKADEQLCRQVIDHWQNALAPTEFEALWHQGSALGLEQATEIALRETSTHAQQPDTFPASAKSSATSRCSGPD